MPKHQKGSIFERCGAFYVRYYVNEIRDGKLVRVQKAERICEKDDNYYSKKAKSVKLKRDEVLLRVNSQDGTRVNPQEQRVCDFWDKTYLPFAKENLRPSTVSNYEHIWKRYLQNHFASLTLKEYRTHMGSQFLTALTKKLGRRSLAHIRSLASGIFTHALNTGLLESNPWHDVKILGKVRPPEETEHYTLDEAQRIIAALHERTDCQLVMALSFFLGLRPGEIAGVRWEDFDKGWVHIQRAVVRGVLGLTKTPESVAMLPLIAPVQTPLRAWYEMSHSPKEGWVFPNRVGDPIDLRELARRVIIPILKEAKIEWKGLYAGRRGGATVLVALTGNALAAQGLLRHKSLATTLMFYKKETPEATLSGMKLLEAQALGTQEPKDKQ